MAKVLFFPKSGDIPVEVCKIRYGKNMLYTQDTDTLAANSFICEFLAFKNNVACTAFINSVNSPNLQRAKDLVLSDRVMLGLYFPTDRWVNPATGLYQLIPDYNATTWSSAGAAAFKNANVGQSKTTRYPNHGQEMYDISGGDYGIDIVNGVIGISDLSELSGVVEREKNYIKDAYVKSVIVASYRNGMNVTPEVYAKYFLGFRNSNASISGDSYTGYGNSGNPIGINRVDQVNRPSSMRWWDFWHGMGGGNMEAANNYVISEFAKTELNNGWFNDFTHWHTMTEHEVYFNLIGGLLDSSNAYSCPYDEAIEYLFLKSFVKRITAKEVDNTIVVYVELRDIFAGQNISGIPIGVDLSVLKTPLSVKLDLSGTYLFDKNVSVNTGECIKTGGELVFELPLSNNKDGVLVAVISETDTPNYIDLRKPEISFSGGVVTTNMPCKVIAWDINKIPIFRGDEYLTETGIEATGVAFIGAINERKQSSIITI